MSITLMETAVYEVIAYLQANLAGFITTVNTARHNTNSITNTDPATSAADVQLDPIRNYFDVELPEMGDAYTPCIIVLGHQSDGVQDNPSVFEADHHLSIIVVATDQERFGIRRRIERYIQAIWLCLRNAQQVAGIGGGFPYWETPYATYEPVLNNAASSLYMQSGAVNIALRLQEFA